MSSRPTVFLLCAVHNNLEHTKAMLLSIKNQSYRRLKTIIVDDGSTDGTSVYVKKNYPEVIVLQGDGNLWWTGAMAWGVQEAMQQAREDDFILTMNNDCTFDKQYASRLVSLSKKYSNTLIGSMSVDADNSDRIWDGGVVIDWSKGKFVGLGPNLVSKLPKKLLMRPVDTLAGRGALIPVQVFRKIGNYNKHKLPHYLADYEFACRAKQSGFDLLMSYQTIVSASIRRTGLGDKLPDRISYLQFWRLLFSRRSRINIIDQWQLIRLACPTRYRLKNYWLLLLKVFYLLSHVFPFVIMRPLALRARKHFFV